MVSIDLSEHDLKKELSDFREQYPQLADDEIFVLWFLRAYVADDDVEAAKALCGGPKDKGVDAVLIDLDGHIVHIVQGKYHARIGQHGEGRADVISFAQIATKLTGDAEEFGELIDKMSPEVAQRLQEARKKLSKGDYSLKLYYVTTGKCSKALAEEAERMVRWSATPSTFAMFDGKQVLLLLADYLDGVAPPIPSLDLEIESKGSSGALGTLSHFDKRTGIDSWVFSIAASSVADLFDKAGTRLFARNVRGFLGSTEINKGMETTLRDEPEYFWYYNNGITIVCDGAQHAPSQGRAYLRVANPQVINGQQTTRTLAKAAKHGSHASVIVRLICVPRTVEGGASRFEGLVSKIVAATNWQNAIFPSDLMANDRRQIEIERQFRKLNYQYIRKRTTKSEARRATKGRYLRLVKKDEIAQAVAGCELDPSILREGKERLFEENWYDTVFPNADPNYYLPRFWLMRMVAYAARGYPERAYAKWLALHFAWEHMGPLCRRGAIAKAFRESCERDNGYVLRSLIKALDAVFRAALRFYGAKRGKGETAVDVSTFFKRRQLDKEFAKFWKGGANKSRGSFRQAWAKFERALKEYAQ